MADKANTVVIAPMARLPIAAGLASSDSTRLAPPSPIPRTPPSTPRYPHVGELGAWPPALFTMLRTLKPLTRTDPAAYWVEVSSPSGTPTSALAILGEEQRARQHSGAIKAFRFMGLPSPEAGSSAGGRNRQQPLDAVPYYPGFVRSSCGTPGSTAFGE